MEFKPPKLVFTEDESDSEAAIVEETPKIKHLSQLPRRRKNATKEEREKLIQGLNHNALAVLPPDIINHLSIKQEDWLAARMLAYSDNQVNRNLGMSKRTLEKWLEDEKFKSAYDVITMDRLNFAITLDRLTLANKAVQMLALLQHPNLKVRLQVMEMLNRREVAIAQIESKKASIGTQINVFENSEWLRKAVDKHLVTDGRLLSRGDAGDLLEGEITSGEFIELYEDQGRDGLTGTGLLPVVMAEDVTDGDDSPGEQVRGDPESETAWSELASSITGLVDRNVLSEFQRSLAVEGGEGGEGLPGQSEVPISSSAIVLETEGDEG